MDVINLLMYLWNLYEGCFSVSFEGPEQAGW